LETDTVMVELIDVHTSVFCTILHCFFNAHGYNLSLYFYFLSICVTNKERFINRAQVFSQFLFPTNAVVISSALHPAYDK